MRFFRKTSTLGFLTAASLFDLGSAAGVGADDEEATRFSGKPARKWQYDPCAQEHIMRWHGAPPPTPPCELRKGFCVAKAMVSKLIGRKDKGGKEEEEKGEKKKDGGGGDQEAATDEEKAAGDEKIQEGAETAGDEDLEMIDSKDEIITDLEIMLATRERDTQTTQAAVVAANEEERLRLEEMQRRHVEELAAARAEGVKVGETLAAAKSSGATLSAQHALAQQLRPVELGDEASPKPEVDVSESTDATPASQGLGTASMASEAEDAEDSNGDKEAELVIAAEQQSGTGGATPVASEDGAEPDNVPTVPCGGPVSPPSAESVAGLAPTTAHETPETSTDTSKASNSNVAVPAPIPISDMDGKGNPWTALYRGCYRIEEELVKLFLQSDVGDSSLTPKACMEFCGFNEGQYFPAMLLGDVCVCFGYEDVDEIVSGGPGTCDAPCAGDNTLTCGGWMAFHLYELVPAGAGGGVRRESFQFHYTYEGCFEIIHVLPGELKIDGEVFGPAMTPVRCLDYCYQSTAFRTPYVALTRGNTCVCGNIKTTDSQAGVCNIACVGDVSKPCGGDSSFDLYRLEALTAIS